MGTGKAWNLALHTWNMSSFDLGSKNLWCERSCMRVKYVTATLNEVFCFTTNDNATSSSKKAKPVADQDFLRYFVARTSALRTRFAATSSDLSCRSRDFNNCTGVGSSILGNAPLLVVLENKHFEPNTDRASDLDRLLDPHNKKRKVPPQPRNQEKRAFSF